MIVQRRLLGIRAKTAADPESVAERAGVAARRVPGLPGRTLMRLLQVPQRKTD